MSDELINNAYNVPSEQKRTRRVRPYPINTLQEAVSLASTIQEANAGLPFDRVLLAKALGTTPTSSSFTMRLNSSAKYGLTHGGYTDLRIPLTSLGEAIVAPKGSKELRNGLVVAATTPEVFERFYQMFNGKRLPVDEYAQNMLQRGFGIHPDLCYECLNIIKTNGLHAGIIKKVGDSLWVDLPSFPNPVNDSEGLESQITIAESNATDEGPRLLGNTLPEGKIFVGYSGDSNAVQYVKDLLDGFNIPYETVEIDDVDEYPVPLNVSIRMRACTAAVLVFSKLTVGEEEGSKSTLPEKMLFQLGAASVLYGDRIVVLSEDGLRLGHGSARVRNVVLHHERPQETQLELMQELKKAGVVKITTPGGASN